MNLWDVLPRGASSGIPGDRLALVDLADADHPVEQSWGDFDAAAGRVAAGLARLGIGVGQRVGILAHNHRRFLEVVFGCLRCGVTPVPVNTRLPSSTVELICRDADIELLFCHAELASLAPGALARVELDAGYESFLGADPAPVADVGEDCEAVLLYTSGSSGRPKGVLHTHASQAWMLRSLLPPDLANAWRGRFLVAAPLYHKNGMLSSKLALAMGASVVLLPRFDARRYIEAIGRYRCTSIGGVPTMYALLLREEDLLASTDLSSVRSVSIGSAPLTGALLEQVQVRFPAATIRNGYGTTEAGPAIFGPHPDGLETPPLALGYPLPDVELRLVGADGRDRDDEGELWVRSPGLMRRYLNLDSETGRRMADGGWDRSGDVMRRDAAGFYTFVSRADDMLVCGGENVYPAEVEALLERHPAVAQAAVVAVADEIKGQLPVAFVVLAAGAEVGEDELKQYAIANAPAYQHPRRVWFVDALPLAGTKKIDRKTLTDRARRRRAGSGG